MSDSTSDQPWPEPSSDVGWQVADGLPRGQVNPHLRVVLYRRIGDESHLVSGVEMLEVAISAGEDRSVHGGAETGGLTFGKRRSGSCHRVGFGGIEGPAAVGGPALLD